MSTTMKSVEGLTVEGQVENDVTEASGTQEVSRPPITGVAGSRTGFPEKGL